ncbi:MAG: hypothetical protein V3T77_11445, partial [Planctomycetota bacterium]
MNDAKALRRTLRNYVAGLLAMALLLAVLHIFLSELQVGRVYWFHLDKERNLPTWFSGAIFFLFGCSAVAAYLVERKRNSSAEACFRLPSLWLGVAALGGFMSLDEIT